MTIFTSSSDHRRIARVSAARSPGAWPIAVGASSSTGATRTALAAVVAELPSAVAVAGDVTDARTAPRCSQRSSPSAGLDLLVNNASELGPSPLPRSPTIRSPRSGRCTRRTCSHRSPSCSACCPLFEPRRARSLNVSSDAAVEAYPGWGGYGSSKAALDHLSAVLAVEETAVRVYAVDPGDMRTDMHQQAFPGEDISDRPLPDEVVPGPAPARRAPAERSLPRRRLGSADGRVTAAG